MLEFFPNQAKLAAFRDSSLYWYQQENFMATKNNCKFDQKIADEKTKSVAVVLAKFVPSMDNRPVRKLVDVQPIVRQQRVTW